MYPVGALVSTNWYFPGDKLSTVILPLTSVTNLSAIVLPSASTTLNSAFSKTFPIASTFVNTALPL